MGGPAFVARGSGRFHESAAEVADGLAVEENRMAANDCTPDKAAKPPANVRAELVAVEEHFTGEGVFRRQVDQAQVGIESRSNPSLSFDLEPAGNIQGTYGSDSLRCQRNLSP